MRGFVLGLLLVVALTVTVLSFRPGGLRRQLRFAARRLRIFLVLGGVYVLASGVLRIFVSSGPLADFGPPGLALVLGSVFIVVAQDPRDAASTAEPDRR